MPFILEPNCDLIVSEGPECFFETVVDFLGPLANEKGSYLFAAGEKLTSVSPFSIFGVSKNAFVWVASVPSVFGHLDFLSSGFGIEGWERWTHFECIVLGEKTAAHRREPPSEVNG